MNVTGRWWLTAGSGAFLMALGVAADRPRLVFGAVGIGAWLLGTAVTASWLASRLIEGLTIDYTLTGTTTRVETSTTATLAVSRPAAVAATPLTVQVRLPPGVDSETPQEPLTLPQEVTEATTTTTISFPIAGEFSFPPPTLTIGDPFGLYEIQLPYGDAPTVTVMPRTPDLHVGQGGEKTYSAYGEHQTDRPGPGVTTRELRQYVPGDDLQQIDWKATARLADAYIRETEGETDREMLLVVDHRHSMAAGPDGEQMLDYAREVGLGLTYTALDRGDPIGLWMVGGDGLTTAMSPESTTRTYRRIQTLLYDLSPTAAAPRRDRAPVARGQALADRLEGDTGTFAETLAPYVSDLDAYVQTLTAEPLVGTIRRIRNQNRREGIVVIITSDAAPAELREAIKTAIQGGGRALVFLTPRCLFESTGLADLDTAYDRYHDFEQLRRDLDAHPRVTVFEIAPDTRLNTLLAHRRTTQEVSQ
jgi:uncharacterized protein (DUF58 family)